MAWDWQETLQARGASSEAPTAKGSARQGKDSDTDNAGRGDASAAVRHDAGIVLRSAGAHAAAGPGKPLELLYGKEYDCAFCRGEGQSAHDTQCPVCRGSGKVSVPSPAVRCGFCRGRGQVPPRSELTCCVCRGAGVVTMSPPVDVCPDCRGRGKRRGQSLSCSRCGGVGVITAPQRITDIEGISTGTGRGPELGRKAS